MSHETAKLIVEEFIEELSDRASDGILGEKPVAIIAALMFVDGKKITGKSLSEIFSRYTQNVKPYFLHLAKLYTILTDPSSSYSVITGKNRELQKAIEAKSEIDRAFSELTAEDIKSLLGKYIARMDSARASSLKDFSEELPRKKTEEWTNHLRGFKPLSDEEMKIYVQKRPEHFQVFEEILDFFDKWVQKLIEEGNPKERAKRIVVNSVRNRQQQLGLDTNFNHVKITGMKQYLKIYNLVYAGVEVATVPPREIAIQPKQPFTALMKIFDLMESLNGPVMIVDKHFDEKGFKFLGKLQPTRVKEVKILIGKSHLSRDFKEIYKSFREEMANEGISVDLRVLEEG